MAISNTNVELRKDDVATGTPVDCNLEVFDANEIILYYGNARLTAVVDTDYTVTLDNEGDAEPVWPTTFTFTPLASLLAKIAALIDDDPTEENVCFVRRQLDYTTDFNETDAFLRAKIAREFDRTIMRFQQLGYDTNTLLTFAADFKDDVHQVSVDAGQVAADRVQTGLDATATAADRVQTGLDATATAADRVQTGLDATATAADRIAVSNDKATVAADKATAQGYRDESETFRDECAGYAASLSNGVSLQGDWGASSGVFPGSGAAKTGYMWKVTVAGTVDGVTFGVDDSLISRVDNASTSTYDDNWFKVEGGTITDTQIIAALGYTPMSNTTPIFRTGEVRLGFFSVAASGWVLMDDGTIGNASSGASNRANADTEALFTAIYNICGDTDAPLLTSGGSATTRSAQGDAATAYAAGCRLTLARALGRALGVAGSGSGLTSRAVGAWTGEETHALSKTEQANMPVSGSFSGSGSTSTVFNPGGSNTFEASNGGSSPQPVAGAASFSVSGSISGTATGGGTTGTAHNNVQPTLFLTAEVKL